MYTIKFTQEAEKQLNKLEINIQERIITVLERVRIRPFHHAKKLIGTQYYRFRVGEYRVIASIEKEVLMIIVIEIGHRNRIYK